MNVQNSFESIFEDWKECMKWFYQEIERIKERPEIKKELLKYKPVLNYKK